MRHADEYIRRRLLSRSEVDAASPLVEGCRCRMWRRCSRGGYGRLWDGERVQQAQRLSHEVFIGPIPDGMDVLHRCDRPGCIEPKHIYAGTEQQNTDDMISRGRHLEGRARVAAKRRGQACPWIHGSKHPQSKLDETGAREIKRRLALRRQNGNRPTVLAREFGVSDSLIRGIRDGRNWSWLT